MTRIFGATIPWQRRDDAHAPDLVRLLGRLGARPWHFELASASSMIGCTTMWLSAKTVDQTQRGRAERRALYVGLWTPTLYLIARSLALRDARSCARRTDRSHLTVLHRRQERSAAAAPSLIGGRRKGELAEKVCEVCGVHFDWRRGRLKTGTLSANALTAAGARKARETRPVSPNPDVAPPCLRTSGVRFVRLLTWSSSPLGGRPDG
jgi:hypothetical protein